MIRYYTGVRNDLTDAANRTDLGLLGTPDGGTYTKRHLYPSWAADNGCFKEITGKVFDPAAWFAWLERTPVEHCEWASCPDVVGDAEATWARSEPWIDKVSALGYPVAIVLQNRLEDSPQLFRRILEAADVVFIGGLPECPRCRWIRPGAAFEIKRCPTCHVQLTEWKLSAHAEQATYAARNAGLGVHMGRVNSQTRLRIAQSWGCTSADGTYLKWKVNTPTLLGWLDTLNH